MPRIGKRRAQVERLTEKRVRNESTGHFLSNEAVAAQMIVKIQVGETLNELVSEVVFNSNENLDDDFGKRLPVRVSWLFLW